MIMYTVMPFELIYQENNDVYTKQSIIDLNGRSVMVESMPNEQYRIVQILSTNPYDFLDEGYMPGTVLSLKPQA